MINVKHCSGCRDDFYNGKNPYGVTECWMRKDAKFGTYYLIHVDQAPPYTHLKAQQLPTCYRRERFVTTNPDNIDSQGFWK